VHAAAECAAFASSAITAAQFLAAGKPSTITEHPTQSYISFNDARTVWMPKHLACQHALRRKPASSGAGAQGAHVWPRSTQQTREDLPDELVRRITGRLGVSVMRRADARSPQHAVATREAQGLATVAGAPATVNEAVLAAKVDAQQQSLDRASRFARDSHSLMQGLARRLQSVLEGHAALCNEAAEGAVDGLTKVAAAADSLATNPCEATVKQLVRACVPALLNYKLN
jgi:hypothetical protein